jgi:hypothetical protein
MLQRMIASVDDDAEYQRYVTEDRRYRRTADISDMLQRMIVRVGVTADDRQVKTQILLQQASGRT